MDRIEKRKETLVAGLSASEARRQREETNVRLRKARRDEQLNQKRERLITETPRAAGIANIDVNVPEVCCT